MTDRHCPCPVRRLVCRTPAWKYGAEAATDEVAPFFHISLLRRAQQALAGKALDCVRREDYRPISARRALTRVAFTPVLAVPRPDELPPRPMWCRPTTWCVEEEMTGEPEEPPSVSAL